MSNNVLTLEIDENLFWVDIKFQNLIVGEDIELSNDDFDLECVVDTGCSADLALPESWEDDLIRDAGEEKVGGFATSGASNAYWIELKRMEDFNVSLPLRAVCSLPPEFPHGLVGAGVWKEIVLRIYDAPADKKMDLQIDNIKS